jgi:hypothetical protein
MTRTRRYTKNKMGQTRMMVLGHVLGRDTGQKASAFPVDFSLAGGEGGIRTPDTLASMPHFECGAFNHSATSPEPQIGPKKGPKWMGAFNQARQDRQGRSGVYCAIINRPGNDH